MTEKQLFDAIDQVRTSFIAETWEDMETRRSSHAARRRRRFPHAGTRTAAAVVALVAVLGVGVTVAAAVSLEFREWIFRTFQAQEVTEIGGQAGSGGGNGEAESGAGTQTLIQLQDDMRIVGVNESFVEQYQYQAETDTETVEQVFGIFDGGLNPLERSSFQGKYEDMDFAFQYSRIGDEIDGYNYDGAYLTNIFHYIDGDTIYAILDDEENVREYLISIDLKTGEIQKVTEHDHLCNSVMSPGGKTILFNIRAEGYWTVLDLETGEESRVEGINGYAHTGEIYFIDDYQIAAIGEPTVVGNTEYANTNVINLKTLQVDTYQDFGDIHVNWGYELGADKKLRIYNIIDQSSFTVDGVEAENIYIAYAKDDYVLFGGDDSVYYLCNLKTQSCLKMDVPKELYGEIELYLAGSENELLITNGKLIYLIDL